MVSDLSTHFVTAIAVTSPIAYLRDFIEILREYLGVSEILRYESRMFLFGKVNSSGWKFRSILNNLFRLDIPLYLTSTNKRKKEYFHLSNDSINRELFKNSTN